jgi:hypothetical protein
MALIRRNVQRTHICAHTFPQCVKFLYVTCIMWYNKTIKLCLRHITYVYKYLANAQVSRCGHSRNGYCYCYRKKTDVSVDLSEIFQYQSRENPFVISPGVTYRQTIRSWQAHFATCRFERRKEKGSQGYRPYLTNVGGVPPVPSSAWRNGRRASYAYS